MLRLRGWRCCYLGRSCVCCDRAGVSRGFQVGADSFLHFANGRMSLGVPYHPTKVQSERMGVQVRVKLPADSLGI